MQYLRQTYTLFSPYFDNNKYGYSRILVLLGIAISAILSAVSIIYVYEALTTLQAILIQPGAEFSVVAWGVLGCLGPSSVFAGFNAISHVMSTWLSKELYHSVHKRFLERWIVDKGNYYIRFVKNGLSINAEEIMTSDVERAANSSVRLVGSWISALANFFVGSYQLWYLSTPLYINTSMVAFNLPGYMLFLAFGYSVLYSTIVGYFDKDLAVNDAQLRKNQADYKANFNHISNHAEGIALKRGNQREINGLMDKLSNIDKVENTSMVAQSVLNFMQNVSGKAAYMFGLILSAPGAISGKFDIFKAFSVSQYFTNIVKFFSWSKENTTELASLEVSMRKITDIHVMLNEADTLRTNSALKINTVDDQFAIRNFSMRKPSGEHMLRNLSLQLPKGKVIKIQGSNGIGKTTLFRCFAGLWPYAQGEIILPGKDTDNSVRAYFIPQQCYFPYRESLLAAITYPDSATTLDKAKRTRIQRLLKSFGFKNETLNRLEEKGEWHKELSGGQQQKIAIIGALIKHPKPDVIFIDEGTNALDPKSKAQIERYLKSELPDTSIVAVVHDDKPEKPANGLFFDYKLSARLPRKQPRIPTFTLHKICKPQN